ncbi:MAG TPA: hypothetical protein VNL77_04305, partial [Roseiflexaceae bacterium]|nr:hypothetical protein [Roseiflexaceae bacterium]
LAEAYAYLEQQAARASRRVQLARAGCERARATRPARRRSGSSPSPPADRCAQLAEVEERLERADRQRDALAALVADADDPAREVERLRRDYLAIEDAAFQIWKVVSPDEYRREAARRAAAQPLGAADTSSTYASGSSDTSSGSSSDWSSGSSGSGGESSDGGSW